MGKFCSNCGKELSEGVKFCSNCGSLITEAQGAAPPPNYYQPPYMPPNYYQPPYMPPMRDIVKELSGKIKAQGVIWLVVAIIQYLLAIVYFALAANNSYYDNSGSGFLIFMGIFILIVAIMNTTFAVNSFKYSNTVLARPAGIVYKYKPVGGTVGVLIYNILFGGLIGIVGAIYAFVVRSFVMSNEMQFLQIEQQFAKRKVPVTQPTQQTQPQTEKIMQHTCSQCGHTCNVKYKTSGSADKISTLSIICPKCKVKETIKL